MQKTQYYFTYILSNKHNTVIYVGITGDLKRRIYEHKNKLLPGFTKRYNVDKLVYFDFTTDVIAAIEREKKIKKWSREKKDKLVESENPNWKDLYPEL